jgi:hypothetical protein
MKKFFVFLLLLFFLPAVCATANITELKIESVSWQAEAGNVVEFAFTVGNRVGPECSAKIDYWIGTESEKVIAGNDTVFLAGSETKKEEGSLLVPEGANGIETFFVAMQCNDAKVIASKPIKVVTPVPTILEFSTLDVAESKPAEPIVFSYQIKSNNSNELIISIEEKILQDNNVVWQYSQQSSIVGGAAFSKKGPILQPGSYSLVVAATVGNKTATISREFSVVAPVSAFPLLSIAALLLLFFAATLIATRFIWPARRRAIAEEPIARQGICLAESEASGVLDSNALNALLEGAGFSDEEKRNAFAVATTVPVIQTVKSYIFTSEREKTTFETVVKIAVSNNSNRDWANVVLIAKIPAFLSGAVSEIAGDVEMQAAEKGSAIKFTVEKIGALTSANIIYRAPKLIAQQEVESIALPAVVALEQGVRIPLKKIKIVKIKKAFLPNAKSPGKKEETEEEPAKNVLTKKSKESVKDKN